MKTLWMVLSLLILQVAAWGLDRWTYVTRASMAADFGNSWFYSILQWVLIPLIFVILVLFVARMRFSLALGVWGRGLLVAIGILGVLTKFPLLHGMVPLVGVVRYYPIDSLFEVVLGVWSD